MRSSPVDVLGVDRARRSLWANAKNIAVLRNARPSDHATQQSAHCAARNSACRTSYLIFAQDEAKAWAYGHHSDEQFPPGPQVFAGADASINFPALGIDLPLVDIYRGVDFD
jgi:hypothetical protein